MERNDYIKLAQYAAVKFAAYGLDAERAVWKDCELVVYDSVQYIPVPYVLSFDGEGNPRHGVRIRDLRANSLIETSLDKIYKLEDRENGKN